MVIAMPVPGGGGVRRFDAIGTEASESLAGRLPNQGQRSHDGHGDSLA